MNPDPIFFLYVLATSNKILVGVAKSLVEVKDRFPVFWSACYENIHGMLTVIHVLHVSKHCSEADQSSKAIFGSNVWDHFLKLFLQAVVHLSTQEMEESMICCWCFGHCGLSQILQCIFCLTNTGQHQFQFVQKVVEFPSSLCGLSVVVQSWQLVAVNSLCQVCEQCIS